MSPLPHNPKPASNRLARLARVLVVLVAVCGLPTLLRAQLPVTEKVTVTDTVLFLDALDTETVTTTDAVIVTPLIAVTAPVVFYSEGSLGFGSIAAGQTVTQSINVSAIGQAPLTLSSAAISQSSAFAVGPISCTNGATSLPTTLPAGGACSFTISFLAPSGTAPSGTITFTNNAALSNVVSTPAGSSFTQSIALNGSGSSTPPPPPPPAVVTIPITETITVTDIPSFLDALDRETITTTDAVVVTPLIAVAAPVVFYSAGSLGFGSVAAGQTATRSINVSAIGQAPLTLSSAAISQSPAFTVGPITCTNGATSLPTTLPAGGACSFLISFLAPSGLAPSGTITFTDNTALSNVPSTPAGSSFAQSIALNGAGNSTAPPPPPPAVVTVPITETITVTDKPSFLDASDAETIHVTEAVTVQVIHVTPVITWAPPAAITYGTALTGTQLDATASYNGASVPGTFVYTPASGTVLGVGSQVLSLSFTPNDITTYATVTAQVPLTVNPATATVSVTGGTFTYDGSPHAGSGLAYGVGGLSDVQTPAVTVSYAGMGTTTYGPSATAPTNAGTYQVTASFVGNASYGPASNMAPITINRAAASVAPHAASKTYGTVDPAFTGTLSGFVAADNVTATYSRAAGETVAGSPYTISATLSPIGVLGNYNVSYNTAPFTITKALLTVAANNASRPYGAADPAFSASPLGFVNGENSSVLTGSLSCATTATPSSLVGTYQIACSGYSSSNYAISFVNGTLTVLPETTSLSMTLSPLSIMVGQSTNVTVTLTAPDMVIPIDPSVLAPLVVSSPIVSDILTNNGACTPVPTAAPGIASCTITLTAVEPNGRTLNASFAGTGALSASTATADLVVTAPLESKVSCLKSDFRNVAVPGGSYLWFNSIFKVRDVTKQKVTITFFQSDVQFQYTDAGGNLVNVNQPMPDAKIVIDPSVTTASTTFDSVNNVWITSVPFDTDDATFLTGIPWLVPAGGIPADIEPVTLCGTFASDTAGVDMGWRWSAAAYSSFSSDSTVLGVKPMNTDHDNPPANRDNAGTPENFKSFVAPGARGKGGKNYTGSYSGSAEIE